MYVPSESVVALRCNPVSSWVAVTEAPEIVAPLGSRIVPRMLPVISCARVEGRSKNRDTKRNIHFDSDFIMDPLELRLIAPTSLQARSLSGHPGRPIRNRVRSEKNLGIIRVVQPAPAIMQKHYGAPGTLLLTVC